MHVPARTLLLLQDTCASTLMCVCTTCATCTNHTDTARPLGSATNQLTFGTAFLGCLNCSFHACAWFSELWAAPVCVCGCDCHGRCLRSGFACTAAAGAWRPALAFLHAYCSAILHSLCRCAAQEGLLCCQRHSLYRQHADTCVAGPGPTRRGGWSLSPAVSWCDTPACDVLALPASARMRLLLLGGGRGCFLGSRCFHRPHPAVLSLRFGVCAEAHLRSRA
jgi:hypothetical protein